MLCTFPSTALATFPGENGKIVFSRPSAICNPFLYTVNPDGTGDQRLTTDPVGDGQHPTWSPDGQQLVFERSTDCDFNPNVTREIFLLNADGGGRTQLTTDQIVDWDPTFLPSGTRIAWGRQRTGAPDPECGSSPDVAAMNTDRTAPTLLTSSLHREVDLDWHPADLSPASGLVFTRHYLYVYDEFCELQNGGATFGRIGSDIAVYADAQADHAPDGDGFVLRNDDGDIALYDRDLPGEQVLTKTPGIQETYPVWSPDGRQIAYLRENDIWVMSADGSNQHPVTSTPQVEGQFDWQPVQRPYVRPLSAGPIKASLVPAFSECTAPNRTHGPPLSHSSCSPPEPASPNLVVSAGESRLRNSAGALHLKPTVGVPGGADDSDVRLQFFLKNVMKPDLSDYTGLIHPEATIRLTDRDGFQRQTTQDIPFGFDVQCTATAETDTGSACQLSTTADALVPGAVPEGTRAIWQLDQVRVYDGGPAGDGTDRSLLAVQGVFIP